MIFLLWAGQNQLSLGILATLTLGLAMYAYFIVERLTVVADSVVKEIGKTIRHRKGIEYSAFLKMNEPEMKNQEVKDAGPTQV